MENYQTQKGRGRMTPAAGVVRSVRKRLQRLGYLA